MRECACFFLLCVQYVLTFGASSCVCWLRCRRVRAPVLFCMPNEEVWVIIGKRLSVEIRVPNFTQSDHRRSPSPPCTHRNLSSNRVKVVLCIVISRPTLLLHSQTCRVYAKCPPVSSAQSPFVTGTSAHTQRTCRRTHTQRSAPHPLLNAQRLHTKANTSRACVANPVGEHTHTHVKRRACVACV